MSLDIPIHFHENSPEARAIQAIVARDHISPEEVVRRAVMGLVGPPTSLFPPDKPKVVPPLSEDEIRQLDSLGKTFGLLADVPDEDIDRMAETIRQTKQEGFPPRA